MSIRRLRAFWNQAEKLAALTAVLLAIPALVIAIFSWRESHQTLLLSQEDFNAARRLILRLDYDAEAKKFRLKPIEDGVTLQTCKVVFPPSMSGPELVMPPDFEMAILEYSLVMSVSKVVEPQPKNQGLLQYFDRFPVIIESDYLAKGALRHSRATYDIFFDAYVNEGDYPQIKIRGALFVADAPTLSPEELDVI